MRNIEKSKVQHFYPWLVCMIPLLMAVYCCFIKSGYFVDEYYSYGFSNSSGATLLDVYGGNLVNQVITSETLYNYITVGADERFSYGDIFENCAKDMTPPLYYCMLNTVCSFFPGVFSKWFGLFINLAAFGVTMLGLYYTAQLLFKSRWVSTLVTICYGFSMGGLNCVTYIRMYAVLTMLSVLLTYLVMKLVSENKMRYCLLIAIVQYLGVMTQYNFAFYAFFLCGSAVIALLFRHNIKGVILLVVCSIVAALVFFASWPIFFTQIRYDIGVENGARTEAGPFLFLLIVIALLASEMSVEICLLGLILVAMFVLKLGVLRRLNGGEKNKYEKKDNNVVFRVQYTVLLIGFILGSVCIVYFAPFIVSKYCYITLPCFSVLMGLPLLQLKKCLTEYFEKKNIKLNINWIGALLAIGVIAGAMRFERMTYMYLDNPEKLELTEAVSSYPCLFFNTNYPKSITSAMDHMCKFKDFYVVDDPDSDSYYAYLRNHENNDSLVVFVDTDPVVSSGLDDYEIINSLMENCKFDKMIKLYDLESTSTFLLYNSKE